MFCAATKGRGKSLQHFSLWFIAIFMMIATGICVFDYTSISTPLISTLKALSLLIAQVMFFSIYLPFAVADLISSFPIFNRERYLGIAIPCIYVIFILNYPLNTLINQVVKSSIVCYAVPAVIYFLYSCLFRRLQSKESSKEVIDKYLENPLYYVYYYKMRDGFRARIAQLVRASC